MYDVYMDDGCCMYVHVYAPTPWQADQQLCVHAHTSESHAVKERTPFSPRVSSSGGCMYAVHLPDIISKISVYSTRSEQCGRHVTAMYNASILCEVRTISQSENTWCIQVVSKKLVHIVAGVAWKSCGKVAERSQKGRGKVAELCG